MKRHPLKTKEDSKEFRKWIIKEILHGKTNLIFGIKQIIEEPSLPF